MIATESEWRRRAEKTEKRGKKKELQYDGMDDFSSPPREKLVETFPRQSCVGSM